MSDYSAKTYTVDEMPADIKQEIDIDISKSDFCTVTAEYFILTK